MAQSDLQQRSIDDSGLVLLIDNPSGTFLVGTSDSQLIPLGDVLSIPRPKSHLQASTFHVSTHFHEFRSLTIISPYPSRSGDLL